MHVRVEFTERYSVPERTEGGPLRTAHVDGRARHYYRRAPFGFRSSEIEVTVQDYNDAVAVLREIHLTRLDNAPDDLEQLWSKLRGDAGEAPTRGGQQEPRFELMFTTQVREPLGYEL